MGNYLSRDALMSSGVKTTEVDAFGGKVLVSELPASLVQKWLTTGMISFDAETEEGGVDLAKLDFVEIAHKCLVNPDDPSKSLLALMDFLPLARKSFGDIQKIAMAAINISDIGGTKEEEEAKN